MRACLLCCVIALAGCTAPAPPASDSQPSVDGGAEPKPSTVLDPQLQALDKARAVEKQVDEAAQAQRKAIEDAGG